MRSGAMRIRGSVLTVGLSGRKRRRLLVVLSTVSTRIAVRVLSCLKKGPSLSHAVYEGINNKFSCPSALFL